MPSKYPISIAPMMDCTDRHYRYMMRFLTRKTLLYTEMVTTGALLFGDKKRHLDFSPEELPLSLQLGGDDPHDMAQCAKLGQDWGYTEVNINVGCPSNRVQNGQFGACLMNRPERVAQCVDAMKSVIDIPVTVKHRIGVDDLDRYVYRLKSEFPDLEIEINGGVRSWEDSRSHLEQVDAVMIGRAAYDDPFMFAAADELFFGGAVDGTVKTRRELIESMLPYIEKMLTTDAWLSRITRHMHSLFSGMPGTKAWRRFLSENSRGADAKLETLKRAIEVVPAESLDAPLSNTVLG